MGENNGENANIYIGMEIKELRQRRGLNQAQLAEMLGVSRQRIQQYENGSGSLSVNRLFDVAKALCVSPSVLIKPLTRMQEKQVTIQPINPSVVEIRKNRPLNILLAEDSSADQLLVRDAIDNSSYSAEISCVTDGIELSQFISNAQELNTYSYPDIILLDLNLPKKDGFACMHSLKSSSKTQDIPIIILTNSINRAEMERAYRMGASGYLVKSFELEEFRATINTVLAYWIVNILPKF